MREKLEAIRQKADAELATFTEEAQLENFRVQILGKKGELTSMLKMMGSLSAEERPVMGQVVNEVRAYVEQKIAEKSQELKELELKKEIESTPVFDISVPANLTRGSYHPITLVQRQCEKIFKSIDDYNKAMTQLDELGKAYQTEVDNKYKSIESLYNN